jgi:hypothetical protein
VSRRAKIDARANCRQHRDESGASHEHSDEQRPSKPNAADGLEIGTEKVNQTIGVHVPLSSL